MEVYQKIIFIFPPVIAIMGIPVFIIAFLKYPVLNTFTLILYSLLIAFVFSLLYISLSTFILKGLPAYKQYIVIVSILSIVSFLWAAPGTLLLTNALLDKSVEQTFTSRVQSKYTSSSSKGSGKTYYFILDSWHKNKQSIKVEVEGSVYDRAKKNSLIQLTTRKGAFSFERRISAKVLENNQK